MDDPHYTALSSQLDRLRLDSLDAAKQARTDRLEDRRSRRELATAITLLAEEVRCLRTDRDRLDRIRQHVDQAADSGG